MKISLGKKGKKNLFTVLITHTKKKKKKEKKKKKPSFVKEKLADASYDEKTFSCTS